MFRPRPLSPPPSLAVVGVRFVHRLGSERRGRSVAARVEEGRIHGVAIAVQRLGAVGRAAGYPARSNASIVKTPP